MSKPVDMLQYKNAEHLAVADMLSRVGIQRLHLCISVQSPTVPAVLLPFPYLNICLALREAKVKYIEIAQLHGLEEGDNWGLLKVYY